MKKLILICSLLTIVLTTQSKAGVEPVKSLDLDRYLGKWFEVASIPQSFQKQCVANTTAEYSRAEKGHIKVVNSCEKKDGTRSEAIARAKVVNKKSNAQLRVSFVKIFGQWIWAFGGDYWVLALGKDYSWAVVGEGSAKYAWILSRTHDLPREDFQSAEKTLRTMGYDTCQVLISVQDGGNSKRTPLCEYIK